MNRRFATASLSALCLLLALVGCQKSADQQQAAESEPTSSSATADSGASSSKPAAREREAAPRPRPIVVPAETVISVVLDETIGSKTSQPGQTFTASLREPVEVEGRVAIPKGARATGMVKDAKPAGRFKGGEALELTLTSIEVHGRNYDVQTTSPNETRKVKGKRPAAILIPGTGTGAPIGQ